MPKAIDWINFIYVNLGFLAQIFVIIIFASIQNIKDNWPQYRCNPMYMPLSDNIQQDFTFCVQNMQSDFMGYLLEPLTFIASSLTNMGSGFTTNFDSIRVIISNIRTFFENITSGIMGVFLNLITEFIKITIGIKDLIGKLIGVMVTFMYIMDGSIKTMESANNGPPMAVVHALAGNCFHPDTNIKLKNGKKCKIKNLHLGDILENGSKVNIVMKINKTSNDVLYKISNKISNEISNNNTNKDYIYVTGTHFILYKNKYIMIQDHPDAIIEKIITCDYFSCIVTDDHQIIIDDRKFYDWDDYILRQSYKETNNKINN